MRVGVIGAGAVGGAIAALLTRAGHEVEVTARGEHLAAIRESGLRLRGGWGDFTATVDAHETLTRAPELVIVATKAQDAPAALIQNQDWLSGIPIVVVQNGLDGTASARKAAPDCDIIGALATFASSYLSPGTITITTAGPTYVGTDRGSDIPARFVARVLNEALPTSAIPNFVGAQWTKLVINQVNALPAITGLSVQEVVAHAGLRRLMAASMCETVRTARARGIHFEKLQGLGNGGLRLLAVAPLWAAELLPRLMARRMGATPNPGSTLQSIRRGQATEIDYLNGAVVREARAVSVPTPVNALMVTLVHEVERTEIFFTPEQVVARAKG